jgi:hypothetical protein
MGQSRISIKFGVFDCPFFVHIIRERKNEKRRIGICEGFFKRSGQADPQKEVEKQGFLQADVIFFFVDHGVLNIWYELKSKEKEIPIEQFSPFLHRDSAKSIIKFLKNANRAVRKHELMDALHIPQGDVRYVMACLNPEYITAYLSLAPDPDCKICYHRGNCERKRTADKSGGLYNGRKPEISCGLWRDDWRLTVQGENQ